MRSALLLALTACGRFGFGSTTGGDLDDASAADTIDAPDPRVFLYSMDRGSTNLRAFTVDLASGDITETGQFSVGAIPWSAAPNRDGTALYVASRQTSMIYTLLVDAETGALSVVDQDPTTSSPEMIAVAPDGSALYVADSRTTGMLGVYGYSIASDHRLTAISGSPWAHAGTLRTYAVAVHPSGRFLYAVSGGRVYGYAIASTGALAVIPSVAWDCGDSSPFDIAIEPSGRFGFVSPDSAIGIPGFTIDDITGAITTTPGSPFATGGYTALSADLAADGTHFVVASNGTDYVSAYRIDASTGSLAHVSASPAVPPGPVWGVGASPVGNDFYVAGVFNDEIYRYRIAAGGLVLLGTHPLTPAPEQIVLLRNR